MLKSKRRTRMKGKLVDANTIREGGLIRQHPPRGGRVGLDRITGTRTYNVPTPVDRFEGGYQTPAILPSPVPTPADVPDAHVPVAVADVKTGGGGVVVKKEKSIFPWLLLIAAGLFAMSGIKK